MSELTKKERDLLGFIPALDNLYEFFENNQQDAVFDDVRTEIRREFLGAYFSASALVSMVLGGIMRNGKSLDADPREESE
jgi:hypothetical protein